MNERELVARAADAGGPISRRAAELFESVASVGETLTELEADRLATLCVAAALDEWVEAHNTNFPHGGGQ